MGELRSLGSSPSRTLVRPQVGHRTPERVGIGAKLPPGSRTFDRYPQKLLKLPPSSDQKNIKTGRLRRQNFRPLALCCRRITVPVVPYFTNACPPRALKATGVQKWQSMP